MVPKASFSRAQLTSRVLTQGNPSQFKWPLVAIPVAHLCSGLSQFLWEDPEAPPCAALSTSRPGRPQGPAKD